MLSDWVLGAHDDIPETTISVVANGVAEDVTLSAGGYYLWDGTGSRSLVNAVADAIATHSELASCTGLLCQDRLTRFTAPIAFTASFGDDEAREMLGFSSNWTTSSTSHVADLISNFLWVPGRLGSSTARKGTQGKWRYDGQVGQSGPGRVQAVHHNRRRTNRWWWTYVDKARGHTTSEAGGEYFTFFDSVIVKFRNFKVYEQFQNDENSDADAALNSPLGPYVWNKSRGQLETNYDREVQYWEQFHRVEIDCVGASEVS